MPNRLKDTTSPYLIQHQDNPVHWQPWDQQALDAAQEADKPILLSIGYSACHWCHVMAHESFENEAIAALMNRHFINIKVDREERPDLDQIYMRSLHLLGEQGGWPLTMFLTPAGEPFWGGTYFPPESRYGRPGFPDVLETIARIWRDERDKVVSNKTALVQALAGLAAPAAGEALSVDQIDQTAHHVIGLFDSVHGGLQGAPKFPQAPILDFLWRRSVATDSADIKATVAHTLNRICQGGIYDHLGGGFARYSVDERWLVPHFEKMLYDNAQLLGLLADAYQVTADPLFAARAKETVGWLEREMMVDGAFAAALDADSEGEEGKYYVWQDAEVVSVVGDDEPNFKEIFDVTPAGNWEGKNILNRSAQDGLLPEKEEAALQSQAARLLTLRAERVAPGRDDKVLADWNGLMIAALARASAIFEEPAWLGLAETAFRFVTDRMQTGDRLAHSFRDGRVMDLGFVEDYAAMADAALALFQNTQRRRLLDQAIRWVQELNAHHWDDAEGGYFQSPDTAGDVLVRPKTAQDGPAPSGNGQMVSVLARLADLTGDAGYRERADALIRCFAGDVRKNPLSHTALLTGLTMLVRPSQIVFV
ncbi:MAG: thioredoxin domain-containing protein, partial [Alphaproteobacteria bacterium]|nr:thioredoxin domain-containing protein [Alphaproteobacteria bacterium]